jgi:hypothetical protein
LFSNKKKTSEASEYEEPTPRPSSKFMNTLTFVDLMISQHLVNLEKKNETCRGEAKW